MRYFIKLSFKGTSYHGWQIQPNAHTVQEELEYKLSVLLKEEIQCMGCGRTDAGVHATEFYVHFDTRTEILKPTDFIFKINSFLSKDIAIERLIPVREDAHARFSAIERTYHYFIHFKKNPFKTETSYYKSKKPDINLMNKACELLYKHSNYECFSKSKTQVSNFECSIFAAHFENMEDGLCFKITANRFLRGMVRAVVGTLLMVGEGKMSIEGFEEVIKRRDRSLAGESVPACGLFLCKIKYPDNILNG